MGYFDPSLPQKAANSVTGSAAPITDAIAKGAHDMAPGTIATDTAKGIIPWLAAGAIAVAGAVLFDPIRKVTKGAFGLLRKVPLIGDAMDTIGEIASYVAVGVAAFVGFKMFQSQSEKSAAGVFLPDPNEVARGQNNSAVNTVSILAGQKSAAVIDHTTLPMASTRAEFLKDLDKTKQAFKPATTTATAATTATTAEENGLPFANTKDDFLGNTTAKKPTQSTQPVEAEPAMNYASTKDDFLNEKIDPARQAGRNVRQKLIDAQKGAYKTGEAIRSGISNAQETTVNGIKAGAKSMTNNPGATVAAAGLGYGTYQGMENYSNSAAKGDITGQRIASVETTAAATGTFTAILNMLGMGTKYAKVVPGAAIVTAGAETLYQASQEDTPEHATQRRLVGEAQIATGLAAGMATTAGIAAAGVTAPAWVPVAAATAATAATVGTVGYAGNETIKTQRLYEQEDQRFKASTDSKSATYNQHLKSVQYRLEPQLNKLGVSRDAEGRFNFSDSENLRKLNQAISEKISELDNIVKANDSWIIPRPMRLGLFSNSIHRYNDAISERTIFTAAQEELKTFRPDVSAPQNNQLVVGNLTAPQTPANPAMANNAANKNKPQQSNSGF